MQPSPLPAVSASQRGSVLLELMFATALALVVIGAVINTSVRQSTHRAVNLETTLASNAAMDVYARLRAEPFAALPTFHGVGFPVPGQHGGAMGLRPVPGDIDGMPGRIEVVEAARSGPTVLYRVTVAVQWTGVGGNRVESIVGYIGERRR